MKKGKAEMVCEKCGEKTNHRVATAQGFVCDDCASVPLNCVELHDERGEPNKNLHRLVDLLTQRENLCLGKKQVLDDFRKDIKSIDENISKTMNDIKNGQKQLF